MWAVPLYFPPSNEFLFVKIINRRHNGKILKTTVVLLLINDPFDRTTYGQTQTYATVPLMQHSNS